MCINLRTRKNVSLLPGVYTILVAFTPFSHYTLLRYQIHGASELHRVFGEKK